MATRTQDERWETLAQTLADAQATSESTRQAYLDARKEGRSSSEARPLRLAWDRARAQASSIEQLLLAYAPAHAADGVETREIGDARAGRAGGV